jgi:hypothetical protein
LAVGDGRTKRHYSEIKVFGCPTAEIKDFLSCIRAICELRRVGNKVAVEIRNGTVLVPSEVDVNNVWCIALTVRRDSIRMI